MKVIFRLVLALMSVAFLFKEVPAQVDQSKENLPVSVKDLRNAPAKIVLDGKSLSLSTYVGRDFMPGSWGHGGSPLMVGVKVATFDKQAFPSRARIDRIWVLFEEQIWASDYRGVPLTPSNSNKEGWIYCSNSPVCEASVQGGPQWRPGVLVDVVVRLIDKEGKHYLIQARRQEIKSSV